MSTGQSCPHSADSSRQRGRSGQTPWSAPASLQIGFHLRGKTRAGVSSPIPTQLPPQPGPFPAPGQAHSSHPRLHQPPQGQTLLLASLPAPALPCCQPQHDAGTAGICLLQNTRPWHSLARSGAGSRGGGMATLWGPSGLIPKAQTGTGTGWHRLQWQGTLEGTSAPGVLSRHSSVCCHAVPGPLCLCTLLGLPWHPEGAGAV